MWSPRAQCDRNRFSALWRHILETTDNLSMWQGSVYQLIVADGEVRGVKTVDGAEFHARTVVLTNGTFLNGLMHIGRVQMPGGRISEPASYGLTEQLKDLGFVAGRMKTGTPVRIDGRTVKWDLTIPQAGDDDYHKFSYLPDVHRELKQRDCYIVYTSEKTHDVLRRGLPDSPLYNGQIKSIGPRYCPSIETKIVTFADKTEHQLFLEPEGETTVEFYLNGFSSSLPMNIQIEALETIPALSQVNIYRPGYAIEYDFFDPTQLRHTLETKLIHGLYFAGQINGTTGYEEAAGQGLLAGANAALKALGRDEFTLARDEAYIGVLIDDLVTKGVDEPYRMFTSRAEYRILLRQDDADVRLTPIGYHIGLVTEDRFKMFGTKMYWRKRLEEFCDEFSVKASIINPSLEAIGLAPLKQGLKLRDLLLRPQLGFAELKKMIPALSSLIEEIPSEIRDETVEAAEILLKYEGYIARERLIADKIGRLDSVRIPRSFDFNSIKSLSTEARQKLTKQRPETIGEASRIPGISPSDVNILLLLMNR